MSSAIPEINYEKLNRMQKLAVFLVVIGPEAAARVIDNFDEYEIEQLCREIANYSLIGSDVRQKAMEEFAHIIGESLTATLGGNNFAREALVKAKGDYKAANLLGRIAPISTSAEVIDEIAEMDARQIYNLVRHEQAQTLAFVMSYLNPTKAAEILMMVPSERREEVIERIGIMQTTKLENVNKVVRSIRKHVNQKDASSLQQSGGVRVVAELLNLVDKDASKTLLARIEERNPTLGQSIQRKMFAFDDLIELTVQDLQRVMREIESNDLVIALKSANDALQRKLLSAVSKRAAETLKDEMDMLGPVRLKEVEAAQDRIIQSVRALEEEGEITLDQGGSDVMV